MANSWTVSGILARLAGVLTVLAVVLPSTDRAEACQCIAITPCQALSFTDAIFTGVVTDISPILTSDGQGVRGSTITIVADRAFVGVAGTIVLRSNSISCDYRFRVGERYLVYANRDDDGSLGASECGRTRPLSEGDEDLAFLSSLPPSGLGGQISGTVERVQIDLLGVRRGEKLSAPAEGVPVTIVGPNETRRLVVTNAAGRFTAKGLSPGKYRMDVTVPSTVKVTGDLRDVRLADRGCAVVTIHLRSDGRIQGRVVDRLGEPVAKAAVSAAPAAFTNRQEFPHVWMRYARSDADGQFAFDGLPPDAYHVGVNVGFGAGPDVPYAPVWFPNVAARSETVPIRLGDGQQRSDLEIVVGDKLRAATIDGVVVMADGAPAAGVHVALKSAGADLKLTIATDRTNTSGEFRLKGLESIAYTVEASDYPVAGKKLFAAVAVTPVGDEPVRLHLTLEPQRN